LPIGRRVSLEGSDTVRILLLQREILIESSFGLFFLFPVQIKNLSQRNIIFYIQQNIIENKKVSGRNGYTKRCWRIIGVYL
jgi:hypothetical protein